MARTRRESAPERVTLDAGPVITWSRGDPRTRAVIRRAIELGAEISVPVIVLAEVLRGGPRDAPVNRVLKAVGTVPCPAEVGRLAGGLLGAAGGSNTGDALVAAEAVRYPGSTLVTSDPDDLSRLLVDHPAVRLQVL